MIAQDDEGARRIGVDIRDQVALRGALRGARVLFHTAALFDLTASWPDLHATNVEGARNVCSAAQKSGVERIVFWSSGSIYGGTKRPVPLTETTPIPVDRLNSYAKSKYLGERAALDAAQSDGLDLIVLRPGEVYGSGATKGVAQALFAFKAGAMNALAGPGTAQHSYIHVEDVARAAIHLAERGEPGGIYNLAAAGVGKMPAEGKELVEPEPPPPRPLGPRLLGRPLFYVPGVVLRLYSHWEVLRARRGWLVEKFGPYPHAAPAGVQFLIRSLVLDSTRLFATGFEPAWPDVTAGLLRTLDEYERSGWAAFRRGRRDSQPPPVPAVAPTP